MGTNGAGRCAQRLEPGHGWHPAAKNLGRCIGLSRALLSLLTRFFPVSSSWPEQLRLTENNYVSWIGGFPNAFFRAHPEEPLIPSSTPSARLARFSFRGGNGRMEVVVSAPQSKGDHHETNIGPSCRVAPFRHPSIRTGWRWRRWRFWRWRGRWSKQRRHEHRQWLSWLVWITRFCRPLVGEPRRYRSLSGRWYDNRTRSRR